MSVNVNNLGVLAYVNGFTLWHYKTADTLEQILTEKYFNKASSMVRNGDQILFNTANTGGALGVVINGDDVRVDILGASFQAPQVKAAPDTEAKQWEPPKLVDKEIAEENKKLRTAIIRFLDYMDAPKEDSMVAELRKQTAAMDGLFAAVGRKRRSSSMVSALEAVFEMFGDKKD